jgi:hypothetical protein
MHDVSTASGPQRCAPCDRWSRKNEGATMNDFYDDDGAKKLFRNFIAKILLRRNTLTGKLYK